MPNLHGRYLSSNVNITVFNSDGQVVSVPVGSGCDSFGLITLYLNVPLNSRSFCEVHN